jgi:hypothetical protein
MRAPGTARQEEAEQVSEEGRRMHSDQLWLVAPGRVQPLSSEWMAGGLANYRNGSQKFVDV